MTTYRIKSQADRDMFLGNLDADAIQDFWFDTDASDEQEAVCEYEIDPEHAKFFEHVLNNDPAVISWNRK